MKIATKRAAMEKKKEASNQPLAAAHENHL